MVPYAAQLSSRITDGLTDGGLASNGFPGRCVPGRCVPGGRSAGDGVAGGAVAGGDSAPDSGGLVHRRSKSRSLSEQRSMKCCIASRDAYTSVRGAKLNDSRMITVYWNASPGNALSSERAS